MNRNLITVSLLSVGFIAALLLSGGCGDDKPTQPPPVETEHLFYVSGRMAGDSTLIKTFSVEQRAFVDSFIIDNLSAVTMAVLGVNESLLLGNHNAGTMVFDLAQRKMVHSEDAYLISGHISPNGGYFDAYGNGLRLIRAREYKEVYYNGQATSAGDFSRNSKYYSSTVSNMIQVYDICQDSVISSFGLTRNGSLFRVYKVWPTVDMKKLFMIGNQGWTLYFAVVDFEGDSVRILDAPLRTWGEEAELSPDGRFLYFINTPFTDHEMPRERIDVYDVHTEQLVTSISTREYLFEPGQMALTSDGKYILVTPWPLGGYDVLLIDAQAFSVMDSFKFGYESVIPELVCTKQ